MVVITDNSDKHSLLRAERDVEATYGQSIRPELDRNDVSRALPGIMLLHDRTRGTRGEAIQHYLQRRWRGDCTSNPDESRTDGARRQSHAGPGGGPGRGSPGTGRASGALPEPGRGL